MMDPTIESQQLRAYVALARMLNMGQVAKELHITPSGVSRSLKALEDSLGCVLFERTTRKMSLTSAGREFLPQANDILRQMLAMHDRARVWGHCGNIRIGSEETIGQFVLPPALREFRESFPSYTVKIEVGSAQQVIELLSNGQIDLALLPEPLRHPNTNFRLLAEDELLFVVHPRHPWASRRQVPRESIGQAKLVVPTSGHTTRELLADYFRAEGIVINPFVEIDNEDAIRHFIRLDLGVGILPRWLVASEIEERMVIPLPLGKKPLKRRWGVLHAASRNLGFAESLFVSICRNIFREMVTQSEAPIPAKTKRARPANP